MRKMMKKISCLALAITLFVSVFAGMDIKVSAATQSESESNNTYGTADSITLGNTIKGKLNSSDDIDYYKFTAPANGKIELYFLHTYEDSSSGWNARVYMYDDGEYTEMAFSEILLRSNEKVTIPYIGATEGRTYYIEVKKDYYNDIAGIEYSISTKFTASEYYEKEFNDKYSEATAITLGKSYKGTLNTSDDKDYYKFTASANGKIELYFLHTYEDSSSGWNARVYMYDDGEYTEMTFTEILLKSNEKVTIPYIGAIKGRTYYIEVKKDFYNDIAGVEYSISTKFTASEYYEKEFNDKYSEATPIVLGKTYKGLIDKSDDADYYKIVSQANGKLRVSFGHTFMDNSDEWEVYIYQYTNGEYRELLKQEINLNDSKIVTLSGVNVVSRGVYYVVVDRGWGSDIVAKEYTIKADYVLSDVSNVKATPKKKAIKLTWKKVSGTTYQVQIKNGKWKTAKTTTGNKCTIKKLKAKKSYKVRIRGYKKVNGVTYYSAWKTVKVKTK